jgi:hypothetical protein
MSTQMDVQLATYEARFHQLESMMQASTGMTQLHVVLDTESLDRPKMRSLVGS